VVVAAGLLLALAAVLLVLEPILRRHATAPAPSALLPDSDDVVDPVQERRDRALAALKEIEFDRATGKLSEEDYGRLHGRYAAEAVAALREADAAAADPVEHLIRRARLERDGGRQRFCTECGASLRGRFCTECGAASAA
jgi:hypothetical protein